MDRGKRFPYAATYIGLKNVIKNVVSRLDIEWIDYKFTLEDFVASDDKVFVFGNYTGTYKKTNKYFTARVAHLWKLKGGKIISFEQFVDSKTVDDAIR